MDKSYDVIIAGGGPAGLTSAIYTSRSFLKTLVFAGNPSGGQLMKTTQVENFPGFPQGILGPNLIKNMRDQAQKFGTEIVDENIVQITGDAEKGFEVISDTKNARVGRCVILATGASARWLGLASEQRLIGKGVSACATCDAFFFKDKVVAVVGGGDASMEEAIFLTKFASKVILITRFAEKDLEASKIMLKEAKNNPKIVFIHTTEVEEVLGQDFVTGLELVNNITHEKSKIDIDGLFIAIGHAPNTSFIKGFVDLDPHGYVKTVENTKTSKEGVFTAGDVADYRYRQAVTAAGLGCMAALDAQKFLASRGVLAKLPTY